MKPLVSVVIPCYNKGQYIGETLDSVAAQTYSNIEVVVIDDGSTDNSWEVISNHSIIKSNLEGGVILHKIENGGVCNARNTGVHLSHGEYILPLDADDIILPSYLEEAIDYFENNPDTKLVSPGVEYFGLRSGTLNYSYSFENLLWGIPLVSASIFRKKDYLAAGGYNPNMLYGYEDWDFYLSLLTPSDKVHQIPKVLLMYRITEKSRNAMDPDKEFEMLKQLYNNHSSLYEKYNNLLIVSHNRWIEYQELYNNVYHSKAYRLGKILLKPFSIIRQIFSRCHQ